MEEAFKENHELCDKIHLPGLPTSTHTHTLSSSLPEILQFLPRGKSTFLQENIKKCS
jgi:hypothetical protein